MATEQGTIDLLLQQLSGLGDVRTRKMFGEYALYIGIKLPALVCDNQLFVKHTASGSALLDESHLAPPYPGAKPYLCVPEELWHDRAWLCELLQITADELPEPKPKKK